MVEVFVGTAFSGDPRHVRRHRHGVGATRPTAPCRRSRPDCRRRPHRRRATARVDRTPALTCASSGRGDPVTTSVRARQHGRPGGGEHAQRACCQRPESQSGIGRPRAPLVRLLGPGQLAATPTAFYTRAVHRARWSSWAPRAILWPDAGAERAALPRDRRGRASSSPVAGLLVVYALTLGFLFLWMPGSGLSAAARASSSCSPSSSVMVLMYFAAQSRSLVGTRGFGADRMFAELRDRIALVGRVPVLPDGWRAWSCILLRARRPLLRRLRRGPPQPLGPPARDRAGRRQRQGHPRRHPVAAAVRGARRAARRRSRPGDFLRAANEYLVRQGWEEGFATAVHLDLDLRTGEYSIANAGHPSPARYTSGRARWTVLDGARGPLLGVVPGASFPRQSGRLDRGDALLFYSDGVIEARGRDLDRRHRPDARRRRDVGARRGRRGPRCVRVGPVGGG